MSRQYLDNTKNAIRSLPCYSQTDVNLAYKLKHLAGVKETIVGLHLNNIFNRHYAAGGWVYSAIGYGNTLDNRYNQIGFMPMAGFTVMGTLTLKL